MRFDKQVGNSAGVSSGGLLHREGSAGGQTGAEPRKCSTRRHGAQPESGLECRQGPRVTPLGASQASCCNRMPMLNRHSPATDGHEQCSAPPS